MRVTQLHSFKIIIQESMRDCRFLLLCSRRLCSSVILRSVGWYLVVDVSIQPIVPILKGDRYVFAKRRWKITNVCRVKFPNITELVYEYHANRKHKVHSCQFMTSWHCIGQKRNLFKQISCLGILSACLPLGCETWSLTVREEHRLRVFENRVLRRIFGPKRDGVTGECRKLHNEELNDLYSSPNIVRVIKSRIMRWVGHVARMEEGRGVHKV